MIIRTRDIRDTSAMLYQLSYEATHWERGQLVEFISPVRSEMMCSIYWLLLSSCLTVGKSTAMIILYMDQCCVNHQ